MSKPNHIIIVEQQAEIRKLKAEREGARKEMSLEDKAKEYARVNYSYEGDIILAHTDFSSGYKQAIKDLIERAKAKALESKAQDGVVQRRWITIGDLEQAAEDLIK